MDLRVRSGARVLFATSLAFTIVLTTTQLVRPGYSPVTDPIGRLGVGDPVLSPLFNGALALLGVGVAYFAAALPRAGRVPGAGAASVGASLVLAAAFPIDVSFHWIFGVLLYAAPAVTIWCFWVWFLMRRSTGLVVGTSLTIGVAAIGLALTLTGQYGALGAGGAERLIDYAGLGWGVGVGLAAGWGTPPGGPATSPLRESNAG